ncbi:MAG: hypothetical protein IKR25_03200 [Muribaculaceae bacterium]|nr:hypothetical protein [Muribaculaceae bacterium]
MTKQEMITELRHLLSDPQAPVTAAWVDAMQAAYPYFTLPLQLYLMRNASVSNREEQLARLAITSPDRRTLAMLLGEGMEQFAHFYPDEQPPATPSTDTTIDQFLDNYGNSSPKEIAAIESAIFNPTPDYADVLAAQERQQGGTHDTAHDEQDERINRFIEQSQQQAQQAAAGAAKQHIDDSEKQEIADAQVGQAGPSTDDSMLSESLAKMYIARRKYSQALEIIENISLNFPEKSIYFADQIRFLRKLVWLENKQNTNDKS